VKIGYSADGRQRRQRLQRAYKCKLRILAVMEGGAKEERVLHQRFAHLRIATTEQFRSSRDLMEYLGLPPMLDGEDKTVGRIGERGSSPRLKP
jgi:hypothetical protein